MLVDRQANAHRRDLAAWIHSARASVGQVFAFNNTGRFEWSQFPGCGPAAEIFGVLEDQRVLELGCGIGANAAALARCGAVVHGVDVAVDNIIQARMLFAELEPRLTFTNCSAEDFLAMTDRRFRCVYSVFGAVGFVDPHVLLPLVRRCLTPHGRLIFSVRHPEWDGGGPLPREGRVTQHRLPTTGAVVRRFEFSRTAWSTVLSRYGIRCSTYPP
ncbi:MAG: class I SAM-dependent methyltransferase, partial [Pseudonocardiaceae bacterium]